MASKNQVRKGMILSLESQLLQKQKMNSLSVLMEGQDNLTSEDRTNITWPYGV